MKQNQTQADSDNSASSDPQLWMRDHYSFAALRDVVSVVNTFPEGLSASELNKVIMERGLARTKEGKAPSPTTLYHYRRALLKLGIVERCDRKLLVAREKPLVARLLASLSRDREPQLAPSERQAFADIVVHNTDCRSQFFDMFMPDRSSYDVEAFTVEGTPVIWQEADGHELTQPGPQDTSPRASSNNGLGGTPPKNRQRSVVFRGLDGHITRKISTEIEIQAILYGIRYWARDQLLLIDEIFREDTGNLMFPIKEPGSVPPSVVRQAILDKISLTEEWTSLSMRNLTIELATKLRIPIRDVFDAVTSLYRQYPGYLVLTPTARSFATITATSWLREDLELRSYMRDESGRFISHIRLHRRLKDKADGQQTRASRPAVQSI